MNDTIVRLCAMDDIPEEGSNGFLVETTEGRFGTLVVRKKTKIFVYKNSCPHIGTPLDIKAGQFLTLDKSRIICSTHGALFRIEDGYCVSGPCAGSSLLALSAMIYDDEIFINLPKPKGFGLKKVY
ncbi:MAG: (2Fe-2S)-binding protein [Magnetovibrio sp.]|nr:(2Fe-2S)-binding protein [Magnetovibrio sp.]